MTGGPLSDPEMTQLVSLLERLDFRQIGEVFGYCMSRIALGPPRHTTIDLDQNPPSYGHMLLLPARRGARPCK